MSARNSDNGVMATHSFATFVRVLAILALLAGAGSIFASSEEQAIIAATRKYLSANGYPQKMNVEVEKVAGSYARATVEPPDKSMDQATVFLKRESGGWKVLTLGTGFDPEDLAKLHIPENLRP